MRVVATRKEEQNQAALDPWTAVHLGAGLALGLMGFRRRTVTMLSACYEVAEQIFERTSPGKTLFNTSGPESLANVLCDLAFIIAGHELGDRWNRTAETYTAGLLRDGPLRSRRNAARPIIPAPAD